MVQYAPILDFVFVQQITKMIKLLLSSVFLLTANENKTVKRFNQAYETFILGIMIQLLSYLVHYGFICQLRLEIVYGVLLIISQSLFDFSKKRRQATLN